jgi:hypothetical protein
MKLSTQTGCQLLSRPASLWLIYLLTVFSTIVSAFGQQPTGKQPEFQGGPGRHLSPAVKVAFKPGPFGPDGKVQPVRPERMKSAPSEHETPQVEEARALAEAGIYTLTTKPHAVSLSAQQFSLLHWKPNSYFMVRGSARIPCVMRCKSASGNLRSFQHGLDFRKKAHGKADKDHDRNRITADPARTNSNACMVPTVQRRGRDDQLGGCRRDLEPTAG